MAGNGTILRALQAPTASFISKEELDSGMSLQIARRLALGENLLVTMAGLVSVALPVALGQITLQQPSPTANGSGRAKAVKPAFEVASVRQNKSEDEALKETHLFED
jgi:hypothetical protein